ncbi:MAG: glycosyltransferase [Planctomycetes bacterium]|nr:glycosyltransferase [Planctomycetota bacterium]
MGIFCRWVWKQDLGGNGEKSMQGESLQDNKKTLLVFNCHESWVYQLGWLGYDLDIVVGLTGRNKLAWDEQIRPLPANSRLITLTEARSSSTCYYCIITHNIIDLLDIKRRCEPRLNVLHLPIEARIIEDKSEIVPEDMKSKLRQYIDLIGGHVTAVSMFKGKSWGFIDDIVVFGSDVGDYPAYSGEIASGLRICNYVSNRKQFLLWHLHEQAFAGLPVRIVGYNPDMEGVEPSEGWDDLKRMLKSHRFYIHTADPVLEDGYNMATIEAMSAGMPVIGNEHPGSPVKHGESGFLSDDPKQLGEYARMLLADRDLAAKMGAEARRTVVEQFSMEKFRAAFLQSIETARVKAQSRVAKL